jgi:hypothetical protein
VSDDRPRDERERGPRRSYAGGEIESHTGGVDRWLLVVYAVLLAWGAYYLVAYWGGE